jgi:plasmid stabilization system protein ParE
MLSVRADYVLSSLQLLGVVAPRAHPILLYGHYRIAYLVKDDRNVDIFGVFHGSLDITRYEL